MFDARSMLIATYDESTGMIDFPYEIEDGRRYRSEPIAFGPGLTSHVIRTRRPLRLSTRQETSDLGAILSDAIPRRPLPTTPGTGPDEPGANDWREAESWLGVPILAGERAIGMIAMEAFEKHAYDDATERLLSTIATSMASRARERAPVRRDEAAPRRGGRARRRAHRDQRDRRRPRAPARLRCRVRAGGRADPVDLQRAIDLDRPPRRGAAKRSAGPTRWRRATGSKRRRWRSARA